MPDNMKRAPTHPGEILRLKVLPSLEVSMHDFARMLDLPSDTVKQLLDGKLSVDDSTAVKLGAVFENSPQFWKNLQENHDHWYARQGAEEDRPQSLGARQRDFPSA